MKTNNQIVNEIKQRLTEKIYEEQLRLFFLQDEPLMDWETITTNITKKTCGYISMEEIDLLVMDAVGVVKHERIKNTALIVIIMIVASEVCEKIVRKFESKEFKGNNPHSILNDPLSFLKWKFYDENLAKKTQGKKYTVQVDNKLPSDGENETIEYIEFGVLPSDVCNEPEGEFDDLPY